MRGDRPAELPALAEPATEALDARTLHRGIDALGDDAHAGSVADARRRGNRGVARGAPLARDEAAIELDGVEADAAHVRQRLGTPEVVDQEPDAGAAEFPQVLPIANALRQYGGLRDFEHQAAAWQPGVGED